MQTNKIICKYKVISCLLMKWYLNIGDGVGVVVRVGDERAALLAEVCGHGVGYGAQSVGHARQQLVHARQLRRARVHQHVNYPGVLHLSNNNNSASL